MADTAQSSSAEEMNVKIKTMQPATYELKISVQATVADLKQRLVDIARIPQDRQRIIYKGRVLNNEQQLHTHGVQEGHTLHLVERSPTAPAPAANQAPQQPSQGQMPIAMGSLELDTDETDVNALLASIFTQLGGQGGMGMPGFVAGEGANQADGHEHQRVGEEAQFIAQQLMDSLQNQAGQDPGMQAFGEGPADRRPNMLASIQTYLEKLQEIMQNPSVLLPGLSYPPSQAHELREQRLLTEAVRGILTPAVRANLSPEQQAFLSTEASWQPPPPAAGSSARQNSASQTDAAQAAAPAQPAASQTPANGAAGADEQVLDADADAIAATVAAAIGRMSAADPTAGPRIAEAVRSAAQGTSEQAQPSESATQPQVDIAQSQSNAGAATEAAAGETASAARQSASTARPSASAAREPASDGRSGDGHRRRRRRAAISPVVTMALGSLLQTTLQGDAFQDPANVLSNAAQLLLTTHSFDRDHRTQVLDNLRAAGSHLYRLAPLLMELARACSAAVAAMQGNAGPLALSSAHYIRPDGSRPAVGYTPAGMQQIVGANMSIPFMPGMSVGAMHIGPNGPRPTMAGLAPAPANGPAPATAGSGGGAPGTTGIGTAAGGGPVPGAGVGQAANRAGHPAGLNFGALLQSALAGAGGQPGQPNRPGVSVGESRQVIQVPGAPPVSIRFGNRPPGPQPPAPGLQGPAFTPVSLQVGNGTPVNLSSVIETLGTMLGSIIRSAVISARLAAETGAGTTAPAAAAAPSGSRPPTQSPGSAAPGHPSAAGDAAAATLLNPPVMQQLARALMHTLGPFISSQAASSSSTGGTSQAGTASGPSRNGPPAPASTTGTTATAAAVGGHASGSGQSSTQLGISDTLDATIGMNPSADAFVGHMDAQGLVDALTQAGATSVSVQGPLAPPGVEPTSAMPVQATAQAADEVTAPGAPAAPAVTEALSTENLPAAGRPTEPAAPSSEAETASTAAPASGVTKPSSQRKVGGLGSAALPSRDKGSKKSHPRSLTPGSTSPAADQPSSSRQSPNTRPAPSQAQQDNVKRARRGDSTLTGVPLPTAGAEPTAASQLPNDAARSDTTTSRGEGVEEIAQPSRGRVQASNAGGLDALMAGIFGGGGGGGGGGAGGSGAGLNMNSLMQVAGQLMSDPEVSRGVSGMIENLGQRADDSQGPSGQSPQTGAGGANAGGGFGAILQSLGPMMQQLAVGASGQSQGAGTQQVAGSATDGSSNWQDALSELDEAEQAEWERTIRQDLEAQTGLVPEKYKDHSTAYLAGRPPGATSMLLPGIPAAADDDESD